MIIHPAPPTGAPWLRPDTYWPALTEATRAVDPPYAVLDRAALSANAHQLLQRAGGKQLRVASKSVRVRSVLEAVLRLDGFAGILAYTCAEALWLAEWCDDVVLGYPTADRSALEKLITDPELARRITIMVDSPQQLDLVDAIRSPDRREDVRVCLELDSALDLPGMKVGVWRSPVRQPDTVRAAAAAIAARPGFTLVGLMAYEAQVAGLTNETDSRNLLARGRAATIRTLQRISVRELAERRAAAVAAAAEVTHLEFVNGGGTGSVESTAVDESVTEIAAGSGLFGPHLFDHYTAFTPAPAASFALSVVRIPAPGMVALLGGGWIASGPPAVDRLPQVAWPEGLQMVSTEMAGEVQTPLRGADGLRVGDRVWLRHTKAGELSEHVNEFLLVDGGAVIDRLPTYRGEGKAFL
ncbi:MAG: alanine racemase [Propionibacteriaceae bacterium]